MVNENSGSSEDAGEEHTNPDFRLAAALKATGHRM